MSETSPSQEQTASAMEELKAKSLPIAFTYTLTFFENLAELAYPWAIGLAVNGLILGETTLLWPLVAIWLAHIALGAFRQFYDTRLFSRLNALMAQRVVSHQRGKGAPVSEISARVDMVEELIEFLEEEAPVLLTMVVGLIGSLAFLVSYDLGSGLVMLALLVPVIIVNVVTGIRAYRVNIALNTQWEKEVGVISDRRPRRWKAHFGRMAKLRVRLSDLDVMSWSLAQFFTLLAVIVVLYRAATGEDAMVGDVVAILAYALRIEEGIDEVPSFVQKAGRLIDIRRRVKQEA